MKLEDVKKHVNDFLDVLRKSIETQVSATSTVKSKPLFLLWTHLEPPNHTDLAFGDSVPDHLTVKPTYEMVKETVGWTDAMPTLAATAMPARILVRPYSGCHGVGYTLEAEFRFNGIGYHRTMNYGPEWERESSWEVIDDKPL